MTLNVQTISFEAARNRRRAAAHYEAALLDAVPTVSILDDCGPEDFRLSNSMDKWPVQASVADDTRAARRYISGFVVILGLLFAACSEEAAPPSLDDVRSEIEPTQESWDVHYVVSEAGRQIDESRPRIEIRADYMATFETSDSTYTVMRADTMRTQTTRTDTTRTDTTRNPQPASTRRVLAYLYDEDGDRSATVRANRLILHDADRRFEAKGNVTVETPEGKTLESEHLVWLEDDRKVRTPGFVRIRTPQENVQGYNLVADEDLETYTLARVTGQVTYEEEEDDVVVSDTASADGGVE